MAYQANPGLMAPPVSLDGPLPLAPAYGLYPTLTPVDDQDEHWINGAIEWLYPPGVPNSVAGCAQGSLRVKDQAAAGENPEVAAITTYLPFTCSALSFHDYDVLKARLMTAFNAKTSYPLEYELAYGVAQPDNPWLGDDETVFPNGATAVSPTEGLAILEDYIGQSAIQGIVHATPGTIVAFPNWIVMPVGGKLRTLVGNLVVSGGGYFGSKPNAHQGTINPNQAWMYATGPMDLRLTMPFIPQDQIEWALDRSDNEITMYAERYALITWDVSTHAAVLIDRSIT